MTRWKSSCNDCRASLFLCLCFLIRFCHGLIGGSDASPEEFPFFVSLVDDDFVHRCGGSLFAPDFVLAAAHCQQ